MGSTYSKYIILLLAGSKYSESSIVLMYLMISSLIVHFTIMYSMPLMAWKMEGKIIIGSISAGVVNIVLNILLIPQYGIYGAGLTSIFSELIIALIVAFYFYKAINKLYLMIFLKLFAIAIAANAVGYYMMTKGLHPLIDMSITSIIFFVSVFVLRIIKIDEIMGILKK